MFVSSPAESSAGFLLDKPYNIMDNKKQIELLNQEIKELQAILDKNNLNYHKKNKKHEKRDWKINPKWGKETVEAIKNSQIPGIITYDETTKIFKIINQ